jgi:hypothetical protein
VCWFLAWRRRRDLTPGTAVGAILASALMIADSGGRGLAGQTSGTAIEDTFQDSRYLTNCIQRGIGIREFLQIMGTRVGRSTLFGIPLQQHWSHQNSGTFAATYYPHSDAPLSDHSFTDAVIATAHRRLPSEEQAQFDQVITSFNQAEMYGVDHIGRVLTLFPSVFSGIGEFTIHKKFLSRKIAGERASLTKPALDRIFEFASESALVVLIHNHIDLRLASGDGGPVYLHQMTDLLARHSKVAIISAHVGLGRLIRPAQASAGSAQPRGTYFDVFDLWRPIWSLLTPGRATSFIGAIANGL